MMQISVIAASVAAVCIECGLFGIFFILSVTSLVLLARRCVVQSSTPSDLTMTSREKKLRWLTLLRSSAMSPLIIANVLLMVTITAHWVLGIHRLFMAIVYRNGEQAATDFFNDLREGVEVARTALLYATMIIEGGVIMYRAWLVWNRNYWIVVFPICSISAFIACGIGLLYQFSVFTSSVTLFDAEISRWITGYCTATLCTNLYCTFVIAYRIWSMNKLIRKNRMQIGGQRDLYTAMAIFIESATMSSVWAIIFVVLYTTKSPLQSVASGTGPTVIGIAFTLITVRVGLGWGQDAKPVNKDVPPRAQYGFQIDENAHPLRTLTLNITQTVERETDYSIACSNGSKPADDLYTGPT